MTRKGETTRLSAWVGEGGGGGGALMFNFSAFMPGSFLWTGCLSTTVGGLSSFIGCGVVGSLVPIMDCPVSDPEGKLFRSLSMVWLFVKLSNGKLLANDVTISRGGWPSVKGCGAREESETGRGSINQRAKTPCN